MVDLTRIAWAPMDSAPPEIGLPRVTVLYAGDQAQQVATALLGTVPGTAAPLATAIHPSPQQTPTPDSNPAPTPDPNPARTVDRNPAVPIVVIASANTDAAELMAGIIATSDDQANRRTRARIWLALLAPIDPSLVASLDQELDEAGRPVLDSVVVLGQSTTAASASSLAAWLHLRHDAPSAAFADLRDMDGNACRFASVAAVAVTSPPTLAASSTARATGDRVAVTVRSAVTDMLAALAGTATEPTPDSDAVVASTRTAILSALAEPDDADAASLESAGLALAEATAVADPAPQLRAAELRRARADSMLAAENARSGLSAKFGRKKRLIPLTEELAEAEEELRLATVANSQYEAAASLRDGLASELAERAVGAAHAAEIAANESQTAAVAAWFTRVLAEASRVQVPVAVRTEAMSRGWGEAAPAVRRYLLVPEGTPLELPTLGVAAGDPEGLVVMATPGLDRPLAAAILVGLSRPATDFGRAGEPPGR